MKKDRQWQNEEGQTMVKRRRTRQWQNEEGQTMAK
jgi:hypothetical protein